MFISIIGTRASGKSSVEEYLISTCHFQPVRLQENRTLPLDQLHPKESETSTPGLKHRTAGLLQPSKDVKIRGNAASISGSRENLPKPLYFETSSDLLDYVTRHWLESFVSCDLDTPQLIEEFIKRPSFLLVSVDAPLLTRYQRLISQAALNLTLQEFVEQHDISLYGCQDQRCGADIGKCSLHRMFRLANVHVVNSFHTLTDLHNHLSELKLPDPDRLRPRWDTYFMTLAALASQRSNCMKRRVGAILVRDKRIVATGYNGTPRNVRNCNEGGCRRCNSGGPSGEALDDCLCLHAEENALLEAGRERVGAGAVLYCNTCPCLGCAIKIVQTGVKEVVYNLSYKVDERTAVLFNEAGVILRQHSPPQ